MAERKANVVWEGDLAHGAGSVTVASGALAEFPVTWASRTERSDGKTSPEELIAEDGLPCLQRTHRGGHRSGGSDPRRVRRRGSSAPTGRRRVAPLHRPARDGRGVHRGRAVSTREVSSLFIAAARPRPARLRPREVAAGAAPRSARVPGASSDAHVPQLSRARSQVSNR